MSRLHAVDPSTITETPTFRIVSRYENGKPLSMLRKKDDQTFIVGDVVTNGTKMRGTITGFNITVNEETHELFAWVKHTWSGVGMALEDIEKLIVLPCEHQFGDPVVVILTDMTTIGMLYSKLGQGILTKKEIIKYNPIHGRIHAIHFLPGKVRYDIDLSFTGVANTRIYNIDSIFVFGNMPKDI